MTDPRFIDQSLLADLSAQAAASPRKRKNHNFHAGDEAYAEQLYYWNTPVEQCLDGRTDVKCTTYSDWTQAWTEIKG